MLGSGFRFLAIAASAISIVSAGLMDQAVAARPVPSMLEVKTPGPKKDKKRTNIHVSTQKGVARGFMNIAFQESRSRGGGNNWSGASASNQKVAAEERKRFMRECFELTGDPSCILAEDVTANSAGGLTGDLARAMAVRLVTELRLPTPTPNFGPNPNKNEWKMLAVGFPIWLWTEGATTMSTSASAGGFTFQMSARWQSTTFDMGDGNTVTCTAMEKYSASVKPGTPSPNCGYAYSKPSLPKGKYRVRAVADWEVTWSVAGFSGVLPAYNEALASIPIGELVALNR